MAILARIIWGTLFYVVGSLITRVLLSLGVVVVTYKGVQVVIDWIMQAGLSALSGLPSELVSLLSYMNIGVCISMITSAFAMRLTLDGLDEVKRFVLR